tara:strand:- start:4925 stop:7099 length:2175 start_codon:yes stop_codon:yes gene_type:complete
MPIFLNSPKDNLTKLLYDPNLGKCKVYRRLTAFFKPSVLKRYRNSLKDIIANDDIKIQIIIGGTSAENLELMRELSEYDDKERDRIIQKRADDILRAATGLNERGSYHRQRMILAWLMKEGKLEFKLSFVTPPPTRDNKNPEISLDHRKIGYFEHKDGTIVCFEGSFNESDSSILNHGEHGTVCFSDVEADKLFVEQWKNTLDSVWNEENTDIYTTKKPSKQILDEVSQICDITDKRECQKRLNSLLKEWIEEDKDTEGEDEGEDEENKIELWPHQAKGARSWVENGCKGILAHATGSGKTFTAIKTLQALAEMRSIFVVVGVPFTFLADQWTDLLNSHFTGLSDNIDFSSVIECHGSRSKWFQAANNEINIFNSYKKENPKKKLSIFVTVNNTLSNELNELLNDSLNSSKDFLFIGDECHRYTSKTYSSALPIKANFRMGLSATPIVDESNPSSGELVMMDYFGEIIDKYDLKQGIADGRLCEYEYYPELCYLNENEFRRWDDCLNQTGRNFKDEYDSGDGKSISTKQEAMNKMFEIIDECDEKYKKFEDLIGKIDDRRHALVFCSEKKEVDGKRDIETIAEVLTKKEWAPSKITAETKRKDRNKIVESFTIGNIESIAAIRVLDEGVDIPCIKTAIILSSSKNRRQFVQRRGRVLRQFDGKDKAKIYDFVIIPPPKSGLNGELIVSHELKRVEEMASDAMNKDEALAIIEKIAKDFNYAFRG